MAGRLDLEFRDELIEQYFKLGYNHAEILLCILLLHDRELSLRQLKRILARRGLKRRHNSSEVRTVLTAIEQELRGSVSDVGYRSVWQRLVTDHGLVVCKETVRHALRIIDPDGITWTNESSNNSANNSSNKSATNSSNNSSHNSSNISSNNSSHNSSNISSNNSSHNSSNNSSHNSSTNSTNNSSNNYNL